MRLALPLTWSYSLCENCPVPVTTWISCGERDEGLLLADNYVVSNSNRLGSLGQRAGHDGWL